MHTHTVRDSESYLLCVPGDSSLPKISDPQVADAISRSIQRWTQGQPLLAHIIRKYIAKYSAQIIQQERAGVVDEIVRQKIIKEWAENEAASYLNKIYAALTEGENRDRLLIAYMQVLSQGSLPYRKNAHVWPEQASLLQVGLLRLQENRIFVSNAVCASVFNMAWIEQQVPGMTRSVSVVNLIPADNTLETDREHKRSLPTKLPARVAIASIGTILLGLFGLSYLKEGSFNYVSAQVSDVTPTAIVSVDQRAEPIQPDPALSADKERFDQGMAAAVNGQWEIMLQQFCSLSEKSAYFMPAAKQLENWLKLYPTDIEMAINAVSEDTYSQCKTLYD